MTIQEFVKENGIRIRSERVGGRRMRMHKHRAVPAKRETYGFSGPVSTQENRAAHGNVCHVDYCSCGATRSTNVNQQHIERGDWRTNEPDYKDEPDY